MIGVEVEIAPDVFEGWADTRSSTHFSKVVDGALVIESVDHSFMFATPPPRQVKTFAPGRWLTVRRHW